MHTFPGAGPISTPSNPFFQLVDLSYKKKDYTRKLTDTDCPFCDEGIIANQAIPELEREYWRVFGCAYPIYPGHLLFTPKVHLEENNELAQEQQLDLFEALRIGQVILGDIFKTKSFNIGNNVGAFAGGSVRHLHWHLIPRIQENQRGAIEIIGGVISVQMTHVQLKECIKELFEKKIHR